MDGDPNKALREPWVMAFDYTRATGPVVGRFLAGLREGRIFGLRNAQGEVIVPPTGYDPTSAASLTDWVEVATDGELAGFSWVDNPLPQHPCPRPFAWALVRLHGAHTCLLHVLETTSAGSLSIGMPVRARFRDTRHGHITDLARFERPEESETLPPPQALNIRTDELGFTYPLNLHYDVSAGHALSGHLRGLAEGRFVGQRCPECRRVYVPSLGCCSICSRPTTQDVSLPDTGTVTTFCIVNIPVRGQNMPLPFACANVLLDGSDTPFLIQIAGCEVSEVRQGMRVRAVWRPPAERGPTLKSVAHFRPLDEPDRDVSSLEARREQQRRQAP